VHFLFNLFNHNPTGQRTLEDVIVNIARQLETLGHTVERCEAGFYLSNSINIVVEGFFEEHIEKMQAARAQGARFLIVATEQPTDNGFNFGVVPEMIDRQAIFPRAAALADGIWSLVPGDATLAWYRRQGPPVAYLPLGYAPQLVRTLPVAQDHSFGFYGSLTPRRMAVLKRFQKAGHRVRIVHGFMPQAQRDAEMSRCKVVLQIRPDDAAQLVSSSRCATSLLLGRPVVAEPHALDDTYSRVVTFAPGDDALVGTAIATAAIWRQAHASQMDKFRTILSPAACVGRALAETRLLDRLAA
jgi:hypothetical protein